MRRFCCNGPVASVFARSHPSSNAKGLCMVDDGTGLRSATMYSCRRRVRRLCSAGEPRSSRDARSPLANQKHTSLNGSGVSKVKNPDPVITSRDHGGGDNRCLSCASRNCASRHTAPVTLSCTNVHAYRSRRLGSVLICDHGRSYALEWFCRFPPTLRSIDNAQRSMRCVSSPAVLFDL